MDDYLYFPPINWSQQIALLETLTGKSFEEIRKSLIRQFAEAAIRLPLLTMLLISGADGELSDKSLVSGFLRVDCHDSWKAYRPARSNFKAS